MALLETLTDDFNAASVDTTKWVIAQTGSGTSVSQSGGNLNLTVPSGANSSASLQSTTSPTTYTIQGTYAYAKVTPSPGSGVATTLLVNSTNSGYQLGLRYYNGGMQHLTGLNATWQNIANAYDSTSWAYWRIRVAAGGTPTAFYDKSPDGVTWTQVLNTTFLADTTKYPNVRAQLLALAVVAGSGGTATFDTFNTVAAVAVTAAPVGVNDTDTTGTPALAENRNTAPNGATDTDTTTGPTTAYLRSPAGINDGDTLGQPTAMWSQTAAPNGVTDPDTVTVGAVSRWPLPDSLIDNVSVGTPDLTFLPDKLNPGSITDVGPVGTPSVQFKMFYTGGYGQGPYGGGLYSQSFIALDPIGDPEQLGKPDLSNRPTTAPGPVGDPEIIGAPALSGTPVGTAIIPLSITDTETLTPPTGSFTGSDLYGQGLYGGGLYGVGQQAAVTPTPAEPEYTAPSNYGFGAGDYGAGLYVGQVGQVSDANPVDNTTYGSGTYGYGIYYGAALTVPNAAPLFAFTPNDYRPALHILGIGPFAPTVEWHGAINYGVAKGNRPSRPALPMPAATQKSFTLRLNDGGEATANLALPRGAAIIFDEMDTDLWWRRKDPRTKILETIGRFNTSHVNVSTSDTGINVALQFDDYRTILGERMVLKYLNDKVDPPESQWKAGTLITEILAFAIPTNTRLDLSELTGDNPVNLGKTTLGFDLPPTSTINDVMENLNAVSPIPWEWWVEMPDDIDKAPKLRFALGTRGLDKGVVLHDLGKGPSPIASWTRNAAAANYVNSLLYSGTDGGYLVQIPAQIAAYGQRDGTEYNGTLNGSVADKLKLGGQRALARLSKRQPTYSIQLAAGFWRGRSHIDIGDTVTLLIRLGREQIYEKFRVSEITVNIDDTGAEEVNLTLGTPLGSADPRSKRSPLLRIVRKLREYSTPPGKNNNPTIEKA